MNGCDMIWPRPIGTGMSAYAMEQDRSGMNRWRFVRPMASRPRSGRLCCPTAPASALTVSTRRRARQRILPVRSPPARGHHGQHDWQQDLHDHALGHCLAQLPSAGLSPLPARKGTRPSADGGAYENYCCGDCNCTGARACALACFGGAVDTGLRAVLATRSGGLADVATDAATDGLSRRFCSEALEIARAICSWLALSCSAVLAFSRVNSCLLALSCSSSCCTLARSRAIVWSNCVTSGGIGAGAASCGTVW